MRKLIYLLIIVPLFLVVACSNEGDTKNNGNRAGETITITHELDETVVTKNPANIVVFDFGILETLDVLGIDVAGLPRGNMPTHLEKYDTDEYANVGSLKEPDFEKIAEINPDLIIISGRQSTLYDELANIAPTIYLDIDTERYMESFEENLQVIGEIFDKEEAIETELATIKDSIIDLQEISAEVNVKTLVILANEDKISAYGPHSRFGIIHDVFNVPTVDENIEASTHGQNISFEYVLEKDPDILYVVDRGAVVGGESSAKQIIENKIIEQTSAYQNDQIVYLDPNYWYLSGGGLVSVPKMVEEIKTSLTK
ncbi:MAG TPA: siderophore ABC transporter substrate-binding protein [Bacillota bacterium]|nr:siderophore ABC transporter substrate-binding protein [Bacillota bacterium]